MEKVLLTSIFSLSHNVFHPMEGINDKFSNIWFVVCKCFEFGPVQRLLSGKELKVFSPVGY